MSQRLPERYWPRGGTDVIWDPVTLRAYCEMFLRSHSAHCEVNAGLVLFLLDEWESAKEAKAAG